MTDAVAALVLQDNYEQTETLSLAEANASSMLDVHQRFLRFLETRRNLGRELEALPERFGDQMRAHRLFRQIVTTQVVNNMLHGGGTTFAFRLHEETGAPASQIARAYACAREIFEMRPLWAEIENLDNRVAAEVQLEMLLAGR